MTTILITSATLCDVKFLWCLINSDLILFQDISGKTGVTDNSNSSNLNLLITLTISCTNVDVAKRFKRNY